MIAVALTAGEDYAGTVHLDSATFKYRHPQISGEALATVYLREVPTEGDGISARREGTVWELSQPHASPARAKLIASGLFFGSLNGSIWGFTTW